jgi:hypothetical protein
MIATYRWSYKDPISNLKVTFNQRPRYKTRPGAAQPLALYRTICSLIRHGVLAFHLLSTHVSEVGTQQDTLESTSMWSELHW